MTGSHLTAKIPEYKGCSVSEGLYEKQARKIFHPYYKYNIIISA